MRSSEAIVQMGYFRFFSAIEAFCRKTIILLFSSSLLLLSNNLQDLKINVNLSFEKSLMHICVNGKKVAGVIYLNENGTSPKV